MTKQDLKSGMVVKCRNGDEYQVFLGLHEDCNSNGKAMVEINGKGFVNLNDFNDDLTCTSLKEFDIMKVYFTRRAYKLTDPKGYTNWQCLWKREEPKELTVSEIEKLLGYPVKIVKE